MNTQGAHYRPKLSFYHANGKGTGSAMQMELHPAHDDSDGCIMMSIANQMTIGDRKGPVRTFAKFDWENKLTVKLDFNDLSKMLQVFRGECETIDDGKGLYHRSAKYTTRIVLRHMIEPVNGYMLEIYRSGANGTDADSSSRMMLNSHEALGLATSLEGSLGVICFGIPMVIASPSARTGTDVDAA